MEGRQSRKGWILGHFARIIRGMNRPDLHILLAAPRGFCAGVDRAIQIVELAIGKFGAPVYVRHEIVHNKFVVDRLRGLGAIFVEELDDVPENDRPVIFSAHGVPKSVPEAAARRAMLAIDATCPLVTKVHKEVLRHYLEGRQIILIGHKGHVEVIGTMGQLPDGTMLLVQDVNDVGALTVNDPENLAYCTQTTLSVDDTAAVIAALRARFPNIVGPGHEDICYATTNRQMAVKVAAARADAMIVIGAPNSSNSMRLVEVGKGVGCAKSMLIQRAAELSPECLAGVRTIAITAGASAPETLVIEVLDWLKLNFNVTIEDIEIAKENITFNVPKLLRDSVAGEAA
jgi:4-hydroxy-3-methylbut-2-en-1-yl diphosphate reductase